MTPHNLFNAYVTHGQSLTGGPKPKWVPVDTFTVRLESDEVLTLQRFAETFEIGADLKLKVVIHLIYHEPTNTVYYYAPKAENADATQHSD